MKLQTQIPFQKQDKNRLIDYHSNVFLLGSCFAEHIGEKLQYHKLRSFCNPFGILFHPLAIRNLISNSASEKVFSEQDIFFQNEQWSSFQAHSKLNSITKEDILENLNEQSQLTFKYLKESSHIIFTFGTAWVYRYLKSNEVVANCHKVPQKEFSKELLTVEQIVGFLIETIDLIRNHNPKCAIIMTVSPVRHLKDGFVENTRSKAHLISAIHQVLENNDNCFYFPSYELVMDELRDYRFYNEDLLHPNSAAINYVWEKFQEVWFTDESIAFSKKIDAVQKSLEHKPFNSETVAYKVFLEKLEKEKNTIKASFPHISF